MVDHEEMRMPCKIYIKRVSETCIRDMHSAHFKDSNYGARNITLKLKQTYMAVKTVKAFYACAIFAIYAPNRGIIKFYSEKEIANVIIQMFR